LRSREEDIILLENYLKGNLSEKQMAEVASRIEHEKDLGLDFQDLKTLSAGIRLSELKGKMDLLKRVEGEMSSTKRKTNIKWQWIVSVILILAIAGFWFLKKANNNDMTTYVMNDEEFYKYILHSNERSLSSDNNPNATKAFNLFTAKEFELAEPLLIDLWESKKDTLAYYYLGITYIQLNNCEKANLILSTQELAKYSIDDLLSKCTNLKK
jgi:hypothetical protein